MFQHQLINAVVQWEWQLKMAEEKQKNLRGEPFTIASAAAPAPAKERTTVAQHQPDQPAYASCTPSQPTIC